MNNLINILGRALLPVTLLVMVGCGGAGDGYSDENIGDRTEEVEKVYSLNQAAFNGRSYQYGHSSIKNIKISGAPEDTDYERWAMLHDGGDYRLYFFKKESNNTLYQFVFNSTSSKYEYGFAGAIPELTISGTPTDADSSTFAMLHDGNDYRLYMRSKTNRSLYQFAFNPRSQQYEYGYNSINNIVITGSPADVDLNRWGMLHDGSKYRFYAFKGSSKTDIYQFAFNGSSYAYGYSSISNLKVTEMPDISDTSSFSMLHDGLRYRFYFKQVKEME